jgi:hypothetical protein
MRGSAHGFADSWNAGASLSRSLTRTTGLTLAFAWLSNRGSFASDLSAPSLTSLVLSFHWIPSGEKRRPKS